MTLLVPPLVSPRPPASAPRYIDVSLLLVRKPSPAVIRMGKRRGVSATAAATAVFLRCSGAGGLRWMTCNRHGVAAVNASTFGSTPSGKDEANETKECLEVEASSPDNSFFAKLAITLGIAAMMTLISACLKGSSSGSPFRLPFSLDGSSRPISAASPFGFTFMLFGYRIIIPEYTPGWVYFWLLMAAGCGLFISEEALNVWVGMTLARNLCLDGNWQSFAESLVNNAPYIASIVLWVYWGVCISDLIPFYLGKLFSQTKASEDLCSKVGISKEKAESITLAVKKYGNLIGFIERFSVGARNPTAFLAGALGISPECFFSGVCCGGLITLPIQLGIGFLLRERPVIALASVATVVVIKMLPASVFLTKMGLSFLTCKPFQGVWTIFPYLLAASTAFFLFLKQRGSNK